MSPTPFRCISFPHQPVNVFLSCTEFTISVLSWYRQSTGIAVAYDPQHELKTLFHKVLQKNFNNNNVSFDIVLFILDNLEKLTWDTNIMATYFPNLLKVKIYDLLSCKHSIFRYIKVFVLVPHLLGLL